VPFFLRFFQANKKQKRKVTSYIQNLSNRTLNYYFSANKLDLHTLSLKEDDTYVVLYSRPVESTKSCQLELIYSGHRNKLDFATI